MRERSFWCIINAGSRVFCTVTVGRFFKAQKSKRLRNLLHNFEHCDQFIKQVQIKYKLDKIL